MKIIKKIVGGAQSDPLTSSDQTSIWQPLRQPLFVGLWLMCALTNTAIWMQTVGAAWIMTHFTSSALMVSLVQTSITLPVFLLGLPGGVLADRTDPKRLLLVTQSAMLAAALVLSVLALYDVLEAWSLLLFTFILGSGSALGMAAWMIALVGFIPREQVPAAVSLSGISINATRALGPALAGAMLVWWSTASVFIVITLCMAVVVAFIWVRVPKQRRTGDLPPETLVGGMGSGLRYIRHSRVLYSALKQVLIFTSGASALWALLPLVAKHELGLDAGGYGLLMAFMGAGAVLAAFFLTKVYRRILLRSVIVVGASAFALATLTAGLSQSSGLVCTMLFLAGMGWMAVNATISTVVQTYAANWVRARVASVYLLVLMGSMALGGVLWGLLAQYLGLDASLLISAASIICGLWLTKGEQISMGSEKDFADAQQMDDLKLIAGVAHEDGPISIEITYLIPFEERAAFHQKVFVIGRVRQRNGAKSWQLYHDLNTPEKYVERFMFDTWLDYLRQCGRFTQSDEAHERALMHYRNEFEAKRYHCQIATNVNEQ